MFILVQIQGCCFCFVYKIKKFSHLYTCSTDKTVRIWDMETGLCLRKLKGHTDFVNSCHPARRGPELICSGSDDGTIIVKKIIF